MNVWIVEGGELHLYKRTGKCNQCGACCKAHIGFKMEVGAKPDGDCAVATESPEEDWSTREGWSMFLAQGIWWYFKVMEITENGEICSALKDGNKCTEWQTDDFRPICRYWPFNPENIKPFPECGFSFERAE